MSSVALQKSMRDNSEELQDFLRDLQIWEKDIKKEDKKLIEKQGSTTLSSSKEVLPIRNKPNIVQDSVPVMAQNHENIRKNLQSRISSCDYDAWEKYDVDKALNSGSEEEETDTLAKKTQQKLTSNKSQQQKSIPHKNQSVATSQPTMNDVTPQNKERAEKFKEEGNSYYAKGELSGAVAKYTQGIALNPSNPILPANRAMAYIKLKKFTAAEKDCTKALKLDPEYIKAYLRRATARIHIGKHSGAIEDYEKVLKLEPWNKDAKKELEKLKRDSSPCVDNKHSKELHEDLSENYGDKMMKKLKVKEDNTNITAEQIGKEDPSIIPPISKPLHMLSTKPLTDISIIEVNSKEEIKKLVNGMEQVPLLKPALAKKKVQLDPHNPETFNDKEVVSIPKPPRTSHQFSQDWRKVVKYEDRALSYLKSIPSAFFHGTEVEVDQLVEVVHTLCSDGIEDAVAPIMIALMKCRSFFLNLSFLETKEKQVFENFVKKMENCEAFKEELKQLKDVL